MTPFPPSAIRVIVSGALNTDITVVGVPHLPKTGQDVYGSDLRIGAGGKSRNVAHMIAALTGPDTVAIVSRTSVDHFGLWKIPIDSLEAAGVNTDYVQLTSYDEVGLYPGLALITVDAAGNRNASVSNRVLDSFSAADIADAQGLFKAAARLNGLLAISLELPMDAVIYAVKLANSYGMRVILDPGGLQSMPDLNALLSMHIYVLKPNEHELRQLTGLCVDGYQTAKQAAAKLRAGGVQNVLITHGKRGAYLFGPGVELHIPVPPINVPGQTDATGCGDQVMAALCAYLSDGATLTEAARIAVIAGTLQYCHVGVQPITRGEIETVTAQIGRLPRRPSSLEANVLVHLSWGGTPRSGQVHRF